jgi:hypothetical protein
MDISLPFVIQANTATRYQKKAAENTIVPYFGHDSITLI